MKQMVIFGVFAFATFYMVHTEVPEYCSLPQDEGTAPTPGADDFQILLYYDAAKDLCYPFKYLGEGGNANRFTLEKLCMRNCSAKAEEIYPMDESKACHFKKALGECFGTYLRYFYDPIHEKCKKFHWTGCVGNGNRFIDHHACNATCAGIHDEGTEEEEDEPDTPVALILGVVFGITGAILIIVIVVLAMQSKKNHKSDTKKVKDVKLETPLQEEPIEMA
ncbi:kunitz-type serine protease inhibitor bitisilin-3-like [Oncorhynchus keta]|uniref:kunitz-type serine protease inhibitor bitisilin-3-like n=1 Tax=Oncorhynchus keta TaxID=8018 RepID=UPI00227C7D44|nr:kunitz-type serine protease inhibitor bitisilin-3-like [Oncorhynchus keta]